MQSNRRALILTLGMYLTISRLQLSVMGQHTGESKGLKRNNNALFLWLWGAKESGSLLNLCMITSWVDDEKMSVQISTNVQIISPFPLQRQSVLSYGTTVFQVLKYFYHTILKKTIL